MHIQGFTAHHFRNLTQVHFAPHPRFNVLFGDNGQGKTNILEAIYILATLRSFRTSRIEEMIRFGESQGSASARVHRMGMERVLSVRFIQGTKVAKEAFVDGKPARALDYFQGVNAVLFATDDLLLPKGPPMPRRRFLDRAIWNTCPGYLKEVQTYERILKSRNALLRKQAQHPSSDPGEFAALCDVYDEQLAATGAYLSCRRKDYLHRVAPIILASFARISRAGLSLSLRYKSSVPMAESQGQEESEPADLLSQQSLKIHKEAHLTRLAAGRQRDLVRGYTSRGPHADDWEVDLDGHPAYLHASQGQIRALVLALKIAEIQHLAHTLGDTPVLLLDDVSSELDPDRTSHLFEFLKEVPCQTFITTTSPEYVRVSPLSGDRRDFRIHAGSLDAQGESVVR